ncbi:MAG: leucyl aminopeptidase [Mycoplasma sp.]
MYSETEKYSKKISAVLATDAKNNENRKTYEFFKSEGSRYIVIEPKVDGYKLYNAILAKYNQKNKEVSIDLDSFLKIVTDKRQVERLLLTLVSAFNYCANVPYTMKTTDVKALKFNIFGKSTNEYKKLLEEYQVVADGQSFARKLQDMPSAIMHPASFIEEVKKFLKGTDVKIDVLETKDLEAKKMGSLLGVGQGATQPHLTPKMMVIEYTGDTSSKIKRGYVGKGVCFDTGGYNIKTGPNMRWMKFDMSGAAIVAGTIYALAKNKIKTNVVAVCPLVINLVSEFAQRPDDIVTSYLGKTIEIDNTDAEGRLILVDALTYAAKDLGATELYDVATLTGAMRFSLGDTYTGTWATNDKIWSELLEGAKQAGEQVWRLPFHSDFTSMMNSKFADIANSVSGPNAGSSRAACFLREFTMDKPYVHLDVAATADKGNVGTGVILRTLYNVAKGNGN